MNSRKVVLLGLLIALIPNISTAGMRCGNKLTKTGETKAVITRKCGQPHKTEYQGLIKAGGQYVHVDQWTYNQGRGKFSKILTFHGGILRSVSNGSRQ